jgi:hypothetical protein
MSDSVVESPFLTEVRSAFGGLLQRGALRIVSSAYDAEAFGNAEVVLAAQDFHVRLIRDRGDVLADVRSSVSHEWRPLERVLRAAGVANAPPEGLLSVEQAALLIETQISALQSGFAPGSWAKTQRALHLLDADAVKRAEQRWGNRSKNKD